MPRQSTVTFAASVRRCRAPVALALALAIGGLASGCAEMQPLDYRPVDQIKPGPGLITGEDGEFVLYGSPRESVLD